LSFVLGGGSFIGKDGRVTGAPSTAALVELPADALPSSGAELERTLQAITISHGNYSKKLFSSFYFFQIVWTRTSRMHSSAMTMNWRSLTTISFSKLGLLFV
jgi:hypothetical protein